MPRNSGIALVGALWALVLLALIAAGATASVGTEARLAARLTAGALAEAAAEGGVSLGLFALATAPGHARWAADGRLHEVTVGAASVRVELNDESGRVDLNYAEAPTLRRLLEAAGVPQGLVNPLVDGIVRAREAAPFAVTRELLRVPGMTPELHRALQPAITVHARQPGVLPEAAGRLALLAAGVERDDVERYLAARARARARGEPPPAPPKGAPGALARNGNATFSVHAQARLPDGATAHAAAVVDVRRPRRRAPFLVLEWSREGPDLFAARSP